MYFFEDCAMSSMLNVCQNQRHSDNKLKECPRELPDQGWANFFGWWAIWIVWMEQQQIDGVFWYPTHWRKRRNHEMDLKCDLMKMVKSKVTTKCVCEA